MSFSEWEIDKKANHEIIDQQDDPGMGWEKIAEFWPEDMPQPDVGMRASEDECCTEVVDGMEKEAKYPMKTPEDALASSMYLLAFGTDSLSKEACVDIAERLKRARDAHGVDIPEEFKEFAKHANLFENERRELYADDGQNLPITSREQTFQSINVFQKNASRWDASKRPEVASRLEKAAERHDIDEQIPYASSQGLSKTASQELEKRQNVAETIDEEKYEGAPISKNQYLAKVAFMQNQLENPTYDTDEEWALDMAEELEQLDKQAGMDVAWGQAFEDPAATFFDEYDPDIYNRMDKEAEHREKVESLSGVKPSDLEGLEEYFDEDVVEEIKRNPEKVIPTLPMEYKEIVKDHIKQND